LDAAPPHHPHRVPRALSLSDPSLIPVPRFHNLYVSPPVAPPAAHVCYAPSSRMGAAPRRVGTVPVTRRERPSAAHSDDSFSVHRTQTLECFLSGSGMRADADLTSTDLRRLTIFSKLFIGNAPSLQPTNLGTVSTIARRAPLRVFDVPRGAVSSVAARVVKHGAVPRGGGVNAKSNGRVEMGGGSGKGERRLEEGTPSPRRSAPHLPHRLQ